MSDSTGNTSSAIFSDFQSSSVHFSGVEASQLHKESDNYIKEGNQSRSFHGFIVGCA